MSPKRTTEDRLDALEKRLDDVERHLDVIVNRLGIREQIDDSDAWHREGAKRRATQTRRRLDKGSKATGQEPLSGA